MKKILICGESFPAIVNLNTSIRFCKQKGIELDEFGQLFANIDLAKPSIAIIENTASLIQSAIAEGVRKEKTNQVLPDLEDVIDMISEGTELNNFFEEFNQSMPEADETEPAKKARSLKAKG
ncbi:MAG: hypothetical protein Q8N05_06365 [Bacteroidota bacterium]|nr:hypothetical protein [Bacteroidota bacterium]